MSQALCLVDHAMHAGSFCCVPCEAICIGSLAPRFRVAVVSCCTRHPCALCASPFPDIRSALDSHASSLVPDPLPSPFFLLLGTRPPTHLPHRADPLSSPLFPPLPLTQEVHHVRFYLHSMNHLCILSPPHLFLVCCAPPPFTAIKYPWSLLFFFIIPLAFGAELQNPVDIVKLGSSV